MSSGSYVTVMKNISCVQYRTCYDCEGPLIRIQSMKFTNDRVPTMCVQVGKKIKRCYRSNAPIYAESQTQIVSSLNKSFKYREVK